MESEQFNELNEKLDQIDLILRGNEYDQAAPEGVLPMIRRHDKILFGDDGKSGIIGEIKDTKDRKAKFDGMKLLVSILAGSAVCVAAIVEVIDKAALWTSAFFRR